MQTTLILAAIFNIIGGLAILFLQGFIAPPIHFNDSGPGLFRMFVDGTAVLFGAAYIAVWQDYRRNRPLLVYGTVLKYWAFAIACLAFSRRAFAPSAASVRRRKPDLCSAVHSSPAAATGPKVGRTRQRQGMSIFISSAIVGVYYRRAACLRF
jgi:hypothetical protein